MARMNTPYDHNQPTENLYNQVKDAVKYTAAGNISFTPEQVVDTDFKLIMDTGIIIYDYKSWNRCTKMIQTWI